MRSLIIFITMLLASTMSFAQNNPIDFEAGGFGADFDWEVFENGDNPPLEIVDNPDPNGANTSATVAKFTSRAEGASFAGTITRGTGTYLLDQTNRTITIKVWKSVISDVGLKLETASNFAFPEIKVANTVTNQWEELTFDFSDMDNPPEGEEWNGITVFPDFRERDAETVTYFDEIVFSEAGDGSGDATPSGNLLTNGDFEAGDDGSWFGNALDIRTEGDNSFNFADVATAGNPFDVNLSQVVDITPGESYTLTFDASTGAGNTRTMVAGIGLNQGPFFANIETVTLTETTQTFTLELTATDDGTGTDFGDAESRVLFDMGADVGVVVLDNVSLEVAGDGGGNGGGGTPGVELVTNGDFEAGDDGSWFGNALDIRTEGGNSFNFADVATAGNPFDVNLSQVVDITPGESYTLTFDASTGAGNTRTMVAGIGLNQGPFFANIETVTLTETTQTFTLELTATDDGTGTDFGDAESRVLFDMGADVGVVVIDNVSLVLAGDGGGGGEEPPIVEGPLSPIDFEADGIGADFTWDVFENGDNPAVEIVDNPDPSGVNTSARIARITARAEGASFAGATTRDVGTFLLDETNNQISIMVWKSVISDVGIKLETASGFAFPEIKQANTVTNQWEELTFDFSGVDNPTDEPWNGITIFPDFRERDTETVTFFDNITFSEDGTVTSVEDTDGIPNKFELSQNFPNPFNPSTQITFTLPATQEVTLKVYDIMGREVATLLNNTRQAAGVHAVTFDASRVSSGVYFYRLSTATNSITRKMTLIK